GTVCVLERQPDLFGAASRERIEEIGDIESDLQILAAEIDGDLLFGLLLLGIVGEDSQYAGAEAQANPAVFLVRQDRDPVQRLPEGLAFADRGLVTALRNDVLVIREASVDEF